MGRAVSDCFDLFGAERAIKKTCFEETTFKHSVASHIGSVTKSKDELGLTFCERLNGTRLVGLAVGHSIGADRDIGNTLTGDVGNTFCEYSSVRIRRKLSSRDARRRP